LLVVSSESQFSKNRIPNYMMQVILKRHLSGNPGEVYLRQAANDLSFIQQQRSNQSQMLVNGNELHFSEQFGFGHYANRLSTLSLVNIASAWPKESVINTQDLEEVVLTKVMPKWQGEKIVFPSAMLPRNAQIRTVKCKLISPQKPLGYLKRLMLNSPKNTISYPVYATGSPYFWDRYISSFICKSNDFYIPYFAKFKNSFFNQWHTHEFPVVHFQGQMNDLKNPKPWQVNVDFDEVSASSTIPLTVEFSIKYVKPQKAVNTVYVFKKGLERNDKPLTLIDNEGIDTLHAGDWTYNDYIGFLSSFANKRNVLKLKDAFIQTNGCLLDLSPGSVSEFYWSDRLGKNHTYKVHIEKNTIIENAIGSFDNDILKDNSADNRLEGRQGDDKFFLSHGGFDKAIGYTGFDQFIIDGSKKTIAIIEDNKEEAGEIILKNYNFASLKFSTANNFLIIKHKNCYVFFQPCCISQLKLKNNSGNEKAILQKKLLTLSKEFSELQAFPDQKSYFQGLIKKHAKNFVSLLDHVK